MKRRKGKKVKKPQLTPKQQRIVAGIVAGKSKRQAMLDAGANATSSSYRRALAPGGEMYAAVMEAWEAAGLTPKLVARRHKEQLNAHETKFFTHEGRVKDTRRVVAHGIRQQAVEAAYRVCGVYGREKDQRPKDLPGPVVNVQINVLKAPEGTTQAGGNGEPGMGGLVIRRRPPGNGDEPR